MTFTARKIVEFKSKNRNFITFRKKLNPLSIKEYFYNEKPLDVLYPNIDIKYCNMYMYSIAHGDFNVGIKYVNETGTYYMFIGANTFWAPAHAVAIGKAVNGTIYLIEETFTRCNYGLRLRELPEEYVDKNERGYRPKSYDQHILFINQDESCLNSQDVHCVKTAYEGIKAFNSLISQFSK